jgi:uncharacterized damage-inducible protein DinB
MSTTEQIFLEYSAQKLRQYVDRIGDCLAKLNDQQVWARGHENENAIGNLALHLSGNVRQWIIASIGGKPDIRVRDREFSARGDIPAADLRERLQATVDEAAGVIERLAPERLVERVTIQNYELSVLEAIYHVVEHFAQHTGQIIFATKLLSGRDLGFYKHLNAPAH